MSVDTERLWQAVLISCMAITMPVIVVVCLVFMCFEVGIAAICGAGFMALMVPVQGYLAGQMGTLRREMSGWSDTRVGHFTEALNGIRVIKMLTLEGPVKEKVESARYHEHRLLSDILGLKMYNMLLVFLVPSATAAIIFTVYALLDNELTVTTVFTIFAYLSVIRPPMSAIPRVVAGVAEGIASSKRIEAFLQLEEALGLPEAGGGEAGGANLTEMKSAEGEEREKGEEGKTHRGSGEGSGGGFGIACCTARSPPSLPELALSGPVAWVEDADFIWGAKGSKGESTESASTRELRGVSLCIEPGELVCVVGKVGSGKSSLLHALLGEMTQTRGHLVQRRARAALCGQEPWVQNATLRDNVLFSLPYDAARYRQALSLAQLEADLESLPGGDRTEIGERGVNLSGGQKARVALARAFYRADQTDLFVFDDVTSALDAKVGRAVLETAILGHLRGKARLVALNANYMLLPKADRVVVMEGMQVVASGPPGEVLPRFDWLCSQGLAPALQKTAEATPAMAEREPPLPTHAGLPSPSEAEGKEAEGRLMAREERGSGVMSVEVYTRYLSYAGGYLGGCGNFALVLGAITIAEIARIGADWWLAEWSSGNYITGMSTTWWLWTYALWTLCVGVFGWIRIAIFKELACQAALEIHNAILLKVIQAPVNLFFDTVPLGSLLNCFSKDLDSIDLMVPEFLFTFFESLFFLLGILLFCAFNFPAFLAVLLPLAVLFVYWRNLFASSSTELKRTEALTRSPLYVAFKELLEGLPHIRAYGMLSTFERHFATKVEANAKVFFALNAMTPWMILRMVSAPSRI